MKAKKNSQRNNNKFQIKKNLNGTTIRSSFKKKVATKQKKKKKHECL